jgi:U6 snRNA-associated Sm-like protein LSm2
MPRQPTLVIFLQALEGTNVIIELHNDSTVRGVMESVDSGLNVVMKDGTLRDVYGRTRQVSSLHIRSSAIRYVHLPASAYPSSTIKTHRRRLAVARRENYAKQQRDAQFLPGKGQQDTA